MNLADEFSSVFKSAGKELHKQKKQRERDSRAAARYRPTQSERITLKDAVFHVLPAAMAAASGDGAYPVSARTLFYQVRPLIQEFTAAELKYHYFSQTLLTQYQDERRSLTGLYYEPRGELHEPHTGKTTPLISSYVPPDWTFNKVLYVEKTGLWPVLKEARLAERYDMAVITGNGYATEACRLLLAGMEENDTRLFVLHDADGDGYEIARTLREATERMPDHSADVIDLGLTVEHAIERELPIESVVRKKSLPWTLESQLNDIELEWFRGTRTGYGDGRGRSTFACKRVELNALTGPDLIAYIEQGLAAKDADDKVIPPPDVLETGVLSALWCSSSDALDELLSELIDRDKLLDTVAGETKAAVSTEAVAKRLEGNRPISWGRAVEDLVAEQFDKKALRERLTELLAEQGMGNDRGQPRGDE